MLVIYNWVNEYTIELYMFDYLVTVLGGKLIKTDQGT